MQLLRKGALAVVVASISIACAKGDGARVSNVSGAGLSVKPLSLDGAGSTLALAVVGGRRLAFAADEDDARVHAFDLDRRIEGAVTPLRGTPAQIAITRDGSLFVALRDRSVVARYRIRDIEGALDLQGEMATAVEPIGLALADQDRTLMVTTGWGAELDVFDTTRAAPRMRVPLGREPRAVIVARDGRAFVTHAIDEPMSVVSFVDGATIVAPMRIDSLSRNPGQGYALASVDGRIYAPQVIAEPDLGATYYGGPTMTPYVAVVEESTAPPPPAPPSDDTPTATDDMGRPVKPVAMPAFRVIAQRRLPSTIHCLLPRAAAIRPGPKPRLLVACMGDDTLIEYLGDKPMPSSLAMKKRPLPGGVTGLAVDPVTDTAVAWAQHSRQLVFVKLVDGPTNEEQDRSAAFFVAASGASRLGEEAQLGRRIFHGASDDRLSADGRACASCHPDGRDDGRVWRTPDGPRQTIMLAGRLADTAPYGWSRHAGTLQEYFADTISRLQGRGLPPKESAALEKYLLSLSAPLATPTPSPSIVAQGKAIFESNEAGCSSCHAGTATTDGLRHDVGTGSNGIDALETPSLRFVAKSAPYFHDGRYKTLRQLLLSNTKMGSTKHLAPAEIDALATYLETL